MGEVTTRSPWLRLEAVPGKDRELTLGGLHVGRLAGLVILRRRHTRGMAKVYDMPKRPRLRSWESSSRQRPPGPPSSASFPVPQPRRPGWPLVT